MRLNRSLPSLWTLAVGAASLLVTGGLWLHERQLSQRALRADFDFSVRQTASRIEQRMASYEQMLRGVQGLFSASDGVDAERFDRYVDALVAGADFAGIGSLGHATWSPQGAAGEAPLDRVAPASGASRAGLGVDLLADPARRAAMQQARDSGGLSIGTLTAATPQAGADPPGGFQMFLPVYAGQRAIDSVAARRAALSGWVLASVHMGDLMSSLYGERFPGISVRVDDGVSAADPARPAPSDSGRPAGTPSQPELHAQEFIGFAGHSWTLQVSALPTFQALRGSDSARIIAVAGGGLSVLLALLTQLLVGGRARAHALAQTMTQELRASEERYRRIVETADEGIWLTDGLGRTSFVNPKLAQLLGYRVDEMQGRPLAGFSVDAELTDADPDAAAAASPPGSGARAAGSAERQELQFRRRDGSVLIASVVRSAIVDGAGRPAGALAMVTDISDRVLADASRARLETQLRESQKMEAIGTLAGGIAHDFNNILAAILGNAALARQQTDDAVLAGQLDQVRLSAERARGLVQQILAFSRRQPHQRLAQPLRPLVEQSIDLLRPLLPAQVALEVDLADSALAVAVDATQLQQVLMNLCTNAWHALGGRSGRVVVGLDQVALDPESAQRLGGLAPGAHAHLWVSDDGCGMDESIRARVFEPFFTTKPVGQGTGLGLSVVHGIVASHGGAITVASAPGQGARFDLYFPLLAATPAAQAPTRPVRPAGEVPGCRVVYVDDDPTMLLLVQALLQRAGHQVRCFDDPYAAMARLREQPDDVDLVISDFNMPGLSGLDVAREIAVLRPGLPVVISSGFVTDELLANAARAGVRQVLQKEYIVERLVALVDQLRAPEAGPQAAVQVAAQAEPAVVAPR